MNKIPHIITSLRVLLSGMLLGIEPFSPFFLFIYLLCGLSDICDGYLAKRLHVASEFGALLDSLADLVFVCVSMFIFIPFIKWKMWVIGIFVVILIGRMITIIIGFYRFRQFIIYHTLFNKITGCYLFSFPILCSCLELNVYMFIASVLAGLSMLEEMIMMIRGKILIRDRKGLWEREE